MPSRARPANLVKKEWRGDKLDANEWAAKVKSEICDVAAYAFMAACILNFDLLEETYSKLEAVEQRPQFKALVDRKKLAAKINRMLGPIPPSDLAKLQEKGEETERGAEPRYSELVDKASAYDQLLGGETTTTRWQPEPHWPSDEELLRRAVRNCHAPNVPRWAVVRERLAVGSTLAAVLCRRFDLNPDEVVGGRRV